MATAGDTSATPEWYQRAVAHQPTTHSLTFEGLTVAYLKWSRALSTDDVADHDDVAGHAASPSVGTTTTTTSRRRGVALVHGTFAHAHWWDFIAPLLTDEYDVVAIDLPGCGDSDHADV